VGERSWNVQAGEEKSGVKGSLPVAALHSATPARRTSSQIIDSLLDAGGGDGGGGDGGDGVGWAVLGCLKQPSRGRESASNSKTWGDSSGK
jgi:hypothetical protein